jgi:toxin ParE1/3/4
VTPYLREAAEADILRQVEWYAAQGVPEVARRFHAAVLAAIAALLRLPEAGAPVALANPRLAGLRSWPVKGFAAFRLYYVVQDERLSVMRVLHGRRDIGAILEDQEDGA